MARISLFALTAALAVGLSAGAMAQSMTSPATTPGSAGRMMSTPGSSTIGTIASASQVRAKLEAKGYTHVQAVKKGSTGWSATAEKNGKQVHVAVDEHGNIMTR